MPWTEHFCNFDRFLRGGQDLELGLLACLAVLCLVLVLMQHGINFVASVLSFLGWPTSLFRIRLTSAACLLLRVAERNGLLGDPTPLCESCPPLRI